MPNQTRIAAAGPHDRTVRAGDGQILHAPADWELLPSMMTWISKSLDEK